MSLLTVLSGAATAAAAASAADAMRRVVRRRASHQEAATGDVELVEVVNENGVITTNRVQDLVRDLQQQDQARVDPELAPPRATDQVERGSPEKIVHVHGPTGDAVGSASGAGVTFRAEQLKNLLASTPPAKEPWWKTTVPVFAAVVSGLVLVGIQFIPTDEPTNCLAFIETMLQLDAAVPDSAEDGMFVSNGVLSLEKYRADCGDPALFLQRVQD